MSVPKEPKEQVIDRATDGLLSKKEVAARLRISPRTLDAWMRQGRLAMCDRLSRWERNFVHDVSQRRKLTHRQQAIVDRLAATYLEVCK